LYSVEPLSPRDDPLVELYNKILNFITRECGLILDVTERTLARAGFNILANVIWEEVANRLIAELGHVIFAAGRPDVFHRVRRASSFWAGRWKNNADIYDFLRISSRPRGSSNGSKVFVLPFGTSASFELTRAMSLFIRDGSCPYTSSFGSMK
jgi:hypothetical protein